jgi:MFS family permease
MTHLAASAPTPWYRAVDRNQWRTLIASNLGWLFDGFETYALILTAGPAMRSLLDPAALGQIPVYIGAVVGFTLLGWGIGGIMGGVLADYIGRKRTMILAILGYSIMTGLTAFAFDWVSFAVLRFLVGIAIGSEWATGASIVAESWPDRARGKGIGLMQCGLGVGFFLASVVWLFVGRLGPDAWRYMFLIGILPALLTVWIRNSISEPTLWQRSDARRRAALERKRHGIVLSREERSLIRFTIADLFVEREIRRRTIVVFLMSLATTLGWWGISSWVPPYIAAVANKSGLPAEQWATYGAMTFNLGGLLGLAAFGFLADRLGRKLVTMAFFATAFVMTPVLFLWADDPALLLLVAVANGFFCMGQYSWMPVWLPEIFPTHQRATAMAFAFNAPRLIAFLGPFLGGMLIANFGGFGRVATIISCIYILGFVATPLLPETRGKPLPDTI